MRSLEIVLALAVLLGGCVSLPSAQRLETFRLGAGDPPPVAAREAARAVAVAVEQPLAQGAFATDRIVVEAGGRLQVVEGARWDERAPEMLQRLIARTLQSAGAVDAVDGAQRDGRAGYALLTTLERMQVAIGGDGAGEARTEIGARLVRLPDRDILATAFFAGTAPAADDDPATLAGAIDAATAVALADLVVWVNDEVLATRRGQGGRPPRSAGTIDAGR